MAKLVLLGLVLPVVVCAAALIGAWRPWRPGAPIAGGLWAGAVALGAGFVPAFLAADPWPDLPPHVTWHWIAWLAVVAAAVGAADGLHRWPLRVRLSAGLALAAGCGWLSGADGARHRGSRGCAGRGCGQRCHQTLRQSTALRGGPSASNR